MENPAREGGAPVGSSVQADPPEFNLPVINTQCAAPQPVHVELSERRRRGGDTFSAAACDFAEDASTAGPICGLARQLLRLGIDPDTPLTIWRGAVKCFNDAPVGRWAQLTVTEGATGTAFRRYEAFPSLRVASGSAESDG